VWKVRNRTKVAALPLVSIRKSAPFSYNPSVIATLALLLLLAYLIWL
jgi:hypothetical protein